MVYTRSATIAIEVLIGMIFMKKYLGFSISKMVVNIVPGLIASAVMFLGGYFIKQINPSVIWQILSILVCVLIYGGVLLIFFRKQVLSDFEVFKTSWHIK